jgi:hypothetical protein
MLGPSMADWITHFGERNPRRPLLLIIDNVKIHLTADVFKAAEKAGIDLLCLPPHTTSRLQPLDVAVFKSFKHDLKELRRLTAKDVGVSRLNICGLAWAALVQSLTPKNIKSGFRKAGMHSVLAVALTSCVAQASGLTTV